MPEGYVSPHVSRLIDQQLMAQTGLEIDDLEDWLAMSNRVQPDPRFMDDPVDLEDLGILPGDERLEEKRIA